MVLGEDRGQKRYGLMLADQAPQPEPVVAEPVVAEPAETERVVFIRAQTVMKPTEVTAPAPQPQAAPEPQIELVAAPAANLPAPLIEDGALFVATTGANVRSGPGKSYGVLDSLAAGEQVLVVADDNPADGWARIRLEGDGVDGYVAERLLTAAP